MPVLPHPKNDDLRQMFSAAKLAAGDRRDSAYLQEVLARAKTRVEGLTMVLNEMERVTALPIGHVERLKVASPDKELREAKTALADAADIQFQVENWIARK